MNNWIPVDELLPPAIERLHYRGPKISEPVVVWVGENGYSDREITFAYYDHGNSLWEFLEPSFTKYVNEPIAWQPNPEPPDDIPYKPREEEEEEE